MVYTVSRRRHRSWCTGRGRRMVSLGLRCRHECIPPMRHYNSEKCSRRRGRCHEAGHCRANHPSSRGRESSPEGRPRRIDHSWCNRSRRRRRSRVVRGARSCKPTHRNRARRLRRSSAFRSHCLSLDCRCCRDRRSAFLCIGCRTRC